MRTGPRALIPDYEQMTCILRVDSSVSGDRGWCIRCPHSQLLEDLLFQSPTLVNGKEVAVLVISVDNTVAVSRHTVDAPLKAIRVI